MSVNVRGNNTHNSGGIIVFTRQFGSDLISKINGHTMVTIALIGDVDVGNMPIVLTINANLMSYHGQHAYCVDN